VLCYDIVLISFFGFFSEYWTSRLISCFLQCRTTINIFSAIHKLWSSM